MRHTLPKPLISPGGLMAIGLFLRFRRRRCGAIVSCAFMPYTTQRGHHMTLLNKVFTIRTLVYIILVLVAAVIMKAASLHYDFSWATALAAN
jgi:hypothetical protein